MKLSLEVYEAPLWVYRLLKLLRVCVYAIPEETENKISDLIEDGEYDEAEKLIETVDKEWGMSTFTTRLNARLNTWRILGEE